MVLIPLPHKVCYRGMWLKRYIATVLVGAIVGTILYGHIKVSFRVSQARDSSVLRDEQHLRLMQLGNTSARESFIKKRSLSDIPDKISHVSRLRSYPTDGYERANFLREACRNTPSQSGTGGNRVRVSYDMKHEAMYCPLCKLASTFWTRVFVMLNGNRQGNVISHPYEVPISRAPPSNLYFDTLTQQIASTHVSSNTFRFLFVRNPYRLLFSAFVDKIVGPNPLFWKAFGQSIKTRISGNGAHSCGDDVTFEQFLRNVISDYTIKHSLNCHVAKYDACQPCKMNYTFVAKMETFKADTFHILSKLNQTQTLEVFEDEFSALHADDAIEDSTSGPYSWKEEILKCIPWHKALQRIWRKLQIRGVIGMEAFPLSDEEADTITKDNFINILKNLRMKTSSSERSWQKEEAFKEAYRDVPSDILDDIRKIYASEFYLFKYNDSPDEIFHKNMPFASYRFMKYDNVKQTITNRL